MSKRWRFVAPLLLFTVAAVFGAALTGVLPPGGPDEPAVTTTVIQTASTQKSDQYGLLDQWQAAYNGTGTHDYRFNGSASNVTGECGNCHMSSGDSTKYSPPFHPMGLNTSDNGDWFYDGNEHRGPNTQLADQLAGIEFRGNPVYCSDCHSHTSPAGFGESGSSGRTNDPHAIHNDVMIRVGCIRCHNYDNVTFTGSVTFTQNNATRNTYGVSNPTNMTRIWDGKFLSIPTEAKYNSTLGTSKTGWTRYGTADDPNASQFGCGDCHGLFHDEGERGFTFDDSATSRKGPLAIVNDTNSIGFTSDDYNFTCGDCHVTDAHAVHTNGGIVTALNWTEANSTTAGASHNASARGAEYCDECHGQNVIRIDGSHGDTQAAKKLGLNGTKDNLPDLPARESGYGGSGSDCGFCHD